MAQKKDLNLKALTGSEKHQSSDDLFREHIERIIRSTEDPYETIDLLLNFVQEHQIKLIYESYTEKEPGFMIAHALKINGARIQFKSDNAPRKVTCDTRAGTVSLRMKVG